MMRQGGPRPTPVWRDHLEHFKRRDRRPTRPSNRPPAARQFLVPADLGKVAQRRRLPGAGDVERSVPGRGAGSCSARRPAAVAAPRAKQPRALGTGDRARDCLAASPEQPKSFPTALDEPNPVLQVRVAHGPVFATLVFVMLAREGGSVARWSRPPGVDHDRVRFLGGRHGIGTPSLPTGTARRDAIGPSPRFPTCVESPQRRERGPRTGLAFVAYSKRPKTRKYRRSTSPSGPEGHTGASHGKRGRHDGVTRAGASPTSLLTNICSYSIRMDTFLISRGTANARLWGRRGVAG